MNLSHEEIAARTGKDRTTITNMIRLLRLPREVQLLVAERRLSMGHARAILGLVNARTANSSRREGRGSRIFRPAGGAAGQEGERASRTLARSLCRIRTSKPPVAELESALGTRVRIVEKSDQRGRIEIEYYSQEELQRIYEWIISTGPGRLMVPAAGVEPATYGL